MHKCLCVKVISVRVVELYCVLVIKVLVDLLVLSHVLECSRCICVLYIS